MGHPDPADLAELQLSVARGVLRSQLQLLLALPRRLVQHRGHRRVPAHPRVQAWIGPQRVAGVPGADELIHLALIPTYTESLDKLRHTVRALAEAEWPTERKICAIITRETDTGGIENVRVLREELGDAFAEFIHILDPLEPGIVVGKSSAMAWGGRYLHRLLVRERGMDPRRIMVTDLDADFRVHPQYFAYLAWTHLTDPNRDTQLYQPIPYLHNNLWQAPIVPATLRRGAHPAADVAQRAAGEAPELQLVLDDASPRPRRRLLGHRRDPGGQPLLLEELLPVRRPVPGRAAVHADLRRCGACAGPTGARWPSSTSRSGAGHGA